MVAKMQILGELGERVVLLPTLIEVHTFLPHPLNPRGPV